MKKLLVIVLAAVMMFGLLACGSEQTSGAAKGKAPKEVSYRPTKSSVAEGIKNYFKDPDSVQVTDGSFRAVMNGDEKSDTEFYIICTVRAKNSFGGYAEPKTYLVHSSMGSYKVVKEFVYYTFDKWKAEDKKFDELGCEQYSSSLM